MLYFGRPLLDQVVLERERLDDRVGDDHLEPLPPHPAARRCAGWCHGAQIASDPVAQHPRLADVQRFPLPVRIQVDAGLFRQPGYLGLEITNRHAVHCAFRRILNLSLYAPRTHTDRTRQSSAAADLMTFTGLIGRICMFPLRAHHQRVRGAADPPEHPDVRRRPHQRRGRVRAGARPLHPRPASSWSSPTSSTSSTARWRSS